MDLFNVSPETQRTVDGIYIKHVLDNSPAGRQGTLQTGDRILEVDGVDLRQATHDKAVDVIKHARSPVTFLVQSLATDDWVRTVMLLVLVLVPYVPQRGSYILVLVP